MLVFAQDERIFFVPSEAQGELLISRELCSTKYLKKKDYSEYYSKNYRNLDYTNKEITFKIRIKNSNGEVFESGVYFVWKYGPFCFNSNKVISDLILWNKIFPDLSEMPITSGVLEASALII